MILGTIRPRLARYMTEIVDVVDESDKIISQEPLESCLELGLMHRAVGVILRNPKNELFLQRRSLGDDYFPGSWTLSCTGHVNAGESCHDAAVRELHEELGLEELNPAYLLKHNIPKIRFENRIEYEIMYLYECEAGLAEIKLDREEVEEGKYISISDLKNELRDYGARFTPDAIASFNKYFDAKRI